MKSLIVFKSIHQGNTEKVANAIAFVLEAKLLKISETKPSDLQGFDLIGFGSGVYGSNLDKNLFALVNALQNVKGTKVFVFSTSGGGEKKNNQKLVELLSQKGFNVLGNFSCKGLITWGPFKLFGGSNKGHPSQTDLENAKKFAKALKI